MLLFILGIFFFDAFFCFPSYKRSAFQNLQKEKRQSPSFGPFHGSTYESLHRMKKSGLLWQALNYNLTSLPWYPGYEVAELLIEDMNPSFDNVGDDMPCQFFCTEQRKKLIHTVGVISQGKLTIDNKNNNYTGIFATGSDSLIIRMSLGAQPSEDNGSVVYIPALSIKYLRNGVPSANSFGMFSLLGQNSYNFFKHDLSNHVPAFGNWVSFGKKLVLEKFLTASAWPSMIGLSDMATWDQNGQHYPNPVFPYRLIFHPSKRWHNAFNDSDPGMPFNEQLVNALKPGLLYEIYAQDQPPFTDISQLTRIGTLEMTSPSLSNYGDRSLFMAHTRFEADLNIFNSWTAGALKDVQNQQNTPAPGYEYPDLPWQ